MSGFEVLLAPLNGLLDFFQKNRHHASEESRHAEAQRQEALQATYIALVATKKYQESNVHNRDKEFELSQLWATAAIKSRKFFEDIPFGGPRVSIEPEYARSREFFKHEGNTP
jgi:hypothetical protein